jgi:hypothetical protein
MASPQFVFFKINLACERKRKKKGFRHETTTNMHNMEPIHNDPLNKACPKPSKNKATK